MGSVAAIVLPVFALIALGAAARGFRVIDAGGVRGVTDFTFFLAMPALLFGAVVEAERFNLLDVAAPYFAACLMVFAVGVVLAQRWLRLRLSHAAIVGLNSAFGNTGMLALPLIAAAFGPPGVALLVQVIALHSLMLLPVATVLIEADGRGTRHPLRIAAATMPSLVRNPILVALAAAVVWRALGITVPVVLHRLLAMLSGAGPTLALFTLGCSLPGLLGAPVRGLWPELAVSVTLKLVALPLVVWGIAGAVGLGPLATSVAVVTAGTPTGANAFFLARRTAVSMESSAATVVVGTALSLVSLSVWLALVRT